MAIKWSLLWLITFCSLFMSGCREVKRIYTINPDLSGKVQIYSKSALNPLIQFGNQPEKPDAEMAKRAVKTILSNTSGVDVWQAVSWDVNELGKLEFKGTAYFKNFNTLNLDKSTIPSNQYVLSNEGGKIELKWQQTGKPAQNKDKIAPLSGKELDKQIAVAKAKFKQSFAMMSGFLGEFREEDSFQLPGTKQSVNGFKFKDGKVELLVDGSEILSTINRLTLENDFWINSVANGEDLVSGTPDALMKQIYGSELPFVAVFSAVDPQFDYGHEVESAKSAYSAMLEALGIAEKPKSAPIPLEGYSKFKTLKVGGVSMTFNADSGRGILPNSQENGYTIHLVGEWGGAVDSIGEVVVTEAVADNGDNLLNAGSEYGIISQGPQLSSDKLAVVLPIMLKLPDAHVKKLKKLAGSVTFTVTSEPKKHDLGLMKVIAGVKAKEFSTEIVKAEKNADFSGYALALKFSIEPNLLKEINFYDETGKKLEINGSASSCINDDCTTEYSFAGEMPNRIGIVINAYDSRQTSSTVFKLENIPVFGR